ncbi:zona pellucida-like domain-containing protein 1 [Pholidichthys leucotaenia]
MVTRHETDCGSQRSAEGFPDLRHELRTPVRHDVHRDTMKADDMSDDQIGSFGGGGSTLTTMRLVILVLHLGLILKTDAQIPQSCILSNTNRPPENSDISVTCNTDSISLSIYLCPMYNSLYNESLMVLNDKVDKTECYGETNFTAVPPVLKFKLYLNESALADCGNNFQITAQPGSGPFSQISMVQHVNISGFVGSIDPNAGVITYKSQLLYKFSCKYPLQYLINNTELAVSGVNLAINDNNGSFISTLSMQLFEDAEYLFDMIIPPSGLNLKTKIYVSVKATNLTDRFHVLLDRCFTTTTPYSSQTPFYDLFVGCTTDPQTKVETNAEAQFAHFNFEAFRYTEHKNLTVSTFYVHCVTRLCEVDTCSSLYNCDNNNKRKRAAEDETPSVTVTSKAIRVATQTTGEEKQRVYTGPVVAIIICLIIISIFIMAETVYFGLYFGWQKPNFS